MKPIFLALGREGIKIDNKFLKVLSSKFEKKIEKIQKEVFKISKKDVPILDLELRYKGSFTPQPQFFANITPEFKTIMTEKCLVK